jgi:hypothetical protein
MAASSLCRFLSGAALIWALVQAPNAALAHAVRGDLDQDDEVTLSDAIQLLAALFQGGQAPYCEPVADANADGFVDVSDPVRMLIFLFLGGPALPQLSLEEEEECEHENQPPILPSRPIYRTYPGFPIRIEIGAIDPEGGPLSYTATALPANAALDETSGVFTWTPGEDQLGPAYCSFEASDTAPRPARVEGVLVILVLAPDPCVDPRCDPALGCDPIYISLQEDCCGEPGARVAEPEAGCPEGRVLHVGRNQSFFGPIGRLQSCDLLRLVELGQGGHVARLHLEARCIDPERVFIQARLATSTTVLFDQHAERDFETRADGYHQALSLGFVAEGFFSEGQEAHLTVKTTDRKGVILERRVRVVLTRNSVPELP